MDITADNMYKMYGEPETNDFPRKYCKYYLNESDTGCIYSGLCCKWNQFVCDCPQTSNIKTVHGGTKCGVCNGWIFKQQ